ncbi:MAG: hypothetical protein FJ144_22705 [Deltaproteobacteria bacterium]|nr:hypothetical protein [Deltaproteobacteria bacterium]
MRNALLRAAMFAAMLFVLPCGARIVAAAEPAPTDPTEKKAPEGEAGSSSSAAKSRREMPSEMILCRGPRGAVYARDAAEGCRYSRLTPDNLVDFGAGAGCVLRRVAPQKGEAAKDAVAPKTCGDLCAAEKDGLTCIVGLRKTSAGGWETFRATESLATDEDASRSAIAVCCGG